jgi:hypothetical protein
MQRNRTTQDTPRTQRKYHLNNRQCHLRTGLPHPPNKPTAIT